MSAEILCTVAPGETRIALIEAGCAVEIFIDVLGQGGDRAAAESRGREAALSSR